MDRCDAAVQRPDFFSDFGAGGWMKGEEPSR
jgi:hypothetical protein